MIKQIDLNVQKPESQRLPKMYAADSINWCNLRVYFDEDDEAKFLQVLKDTPAIVAFPAIWSYPPVLAHLTLKDTLPSLMNHWKFSTYLKWEFTKAWTKVIFSRAFVSHVFHKLFPKK